MTKNTDVLWYAVKLWLGVIAEQRRRAAIDGGGSPCDPIPHETLNLDTRERLECYIYYLACLSFYGSSDPQDEQGCLTCQLALTACLAANGGTDKKWCGCDKAE